MRRIKRTTPFFKHREVSVDNQLPAALARFLASRGVDCQHVLDVNLGKSSDAEIWEYANRHDCVVIS
jgi:predicted nuclease of predicted toxin-antitoxin system